MTQPPDAATVQRLRSRFGVPSTTPVVDVLKAYESTDALGAERKAKALASVAAGQLYQQPAASPPEAAPAPTLTPLATASTLPSEPAALSSISKQASFTREPQPSIESQEWEAATEFGLPKGDYENKNTCHAWNEAPHSQFNVRSRYYMTKGHKGKKVPSMPSACELKHVLLIPSNEKLYHIANHWPLPPRPPDAQPWIIVTFLVPPLGKGPKLHLVMVFERKPSQDDTLEEHDRDSFAAMFAKCFDEQSGGDFLANRIKVLPFLTAGANFVICRLVNNQPGLIVAAIQTHQYNGEGYAEVDIDIEDMKQSAFASLAKNIIDAVTPRVRSYVIDLAFMLQGENEAELPERCIGGCRLVRLDLKKPDAATISPMQQRAKSRSLSDNATKRASQVRGALRLSRAMIKGSAANARASAVRNSRYSRGDSVTE